jgi:hypothetical protein
MMACIADCEVDLLSCLNDAKVPNPTALMPLALATLLQPVSPAPSTAAPPVDATAAASERRSLLTSIQQGVGRAGRGIRQTLVGVGDFKPAAETCAVAISILAPALAVLFELIARAFSNRGDTAPPPCSGGDCGLGPMPDLVGGGLNTLAILLICLPALYAIGLLLARRRWPRPAQSWSVFALTIVAGGLALLGIAQVVTSGFYYPAEWSDVASR